MILVSSVPSEAGGKSKHKKYVSKIASTKNESTKNKKLQGFYV
jgi:hypothetical protein